MKINQVFFVSFENTIPDLNSVSDEQDVMTLDNRHGAFRAYQHFLHLMVYNLSIY